VGFVWVQTKPYLFHPFGDRRKHLLGLGFALTVHDRVVGVPFEHDCGVCPGQPGIERIVHE
jgi:hypothetical protein